MDWEKLIVATAQHGEKYIGETTLDETELTGCMEHKQPVLLRRARMLITQLQINQGPGGQVLGAGTLAFVMPVDGAQGPLERLWIDVSSFYFPKSNPVIQQALEGLINVCLAAEAKQNAGLTIATPADIVRLRKESH